MNKYQYKVQGVDYEVEIEEVEGNIAKVNVNGIPFEVEMQQPINAAKHPTIVKPKVAAPAAVAANSSPKPAAPSQHASRRQWQSRESSAARYHYHGQREGR